jgi:hypothetical protein
MVWIGKVTFFLRKSMVCKVGFRLSHITRFDERMEEARFMLQFLTHAGFNLQTESLCKSGGYPHQQNQRFVSLKGVFFYPPAKTKLTIPLEDLLMCITQCVRLNLVNTLCIAKRWPAAFRDRLACQLLGPNMTQQPSTRAKSFDTVLGMVESAVINVVSICPSAVEL